MTKRVMILGASARLIVDDIDSFRDRLVQEGLMDPGELLLFDEPTLPDGAALAAAFAPMPTLPCVGIERSLPPGEIRKRQKEQRRRWRKGK